MARKPPLEKSPAPVSLSLGLLDSYELAFKRSEALAIRKEEIGRTLSSFLQASGDILGDVDFVSTNFRQDPQKNIVTSDSTNNLTFERRQRAFVISQPLFQGFRAIGGLSSAGSLRKQKQAEWARAKQLLFMDTYNSFYEYLRLKKDVETIEGISNLFEDRIKNLRDWEEIGRSRPSEVASARLKLENFKAELAKSKGNLALAKNLFAFLIGMRVDPEELKDEKIPMPEDQPLNVFKLAQKRPDVEAAKYALTVARGALIVAQSELWPKLTLDANLYEHREGIQSGTSWDTLFTLRVPLGKGGTTVGKVRDALSDWREAKLTYSLAGRAAEREITDALDQWKSAVESYNSLAKAQDAAQENFTLQSEDYKRHLVPNIEVLDAMQTLFETKRDSNQAFYDMKKSYWQLEIAKGNCCDTF